MSLKDYLENISNKFYEAQGKDPVDKAKEGVQSALGSAFGKTANKNPSVSQQLAQDDAAALDRYSIDDFNAVMNRTGESSEDTSSSDAGVYDFNAANDAYQKRMADENADWTYNTWFENQTGAGRSREEDIQYLWDMLTSEEFNDVLSDEFKQSVLYDLDNSFTNWYDEQKANNKVSKMYGPAATENVYDYVSASDLDELTDWIIANNQIAPTDLGIYSSNGYVMPGDPLFKSALAYSNIEQAAKYGTNLTEDELNALIALTNPSLIGSTVDVDEYDKKTLTEEQQEDLNTFAMTNGPVRASYYTTPSGNFYAYDPNADFDNMALRASLMSNQQNLLDFYSNFNNAKTSMPEFEEIYNQTPEYWNVVADTGQYLSDENAWNTGKALSDEELRKAIGTIAYNSGYYYRGGNE